MADGPLLEIDSLTFRYRRATEPAIRDLSLSLAPGEVLLVAGPSGCGKSTLIRAINGLIPHAYPGELPAGRSSAAASSRYAASRDLAEIVGTLLQDPPSRSSARPSKASWHSARRTSAWPAM